MDDRIENVVEKSDVVVMAVPSAYVEDALKNLPANAFIGKKVVSAIKGILPATNQLLNDYMAEHFKLPLQGLFYRARSLPCRGGGFRKIILL